MLKSILQRRDILGKNLFSGSCSERQITKWRTLSRPRRPFWTHKKKLGESNKLGLIIYIFCRNAWGKEMVAASKRSILVKLWIQHWNPGEILTNFHVNGYFVTWKLTELDRKNEIWRCSMWASDPDAAVIQRCRGTLGKRAVLCPLKSYPGFEVV